MSEVHRGDYGISQRFYFHLYDDTGADLTTAPSFVAGDVTLVKDEAAAANVTNLPVSEGGGLYSILLTATEKQCILGGITIDDASSPDIWMPTGFVFTTEVPVGEYGGGVWFDGDSGATGTTVGVHGTPLRPVNIFADAVTLATTTKLYRIYHLGGLSSTSVSSSMIGLEVIRIGSAEQRDLAFSGSPNVTEARFENVKLTGISGSGLFTADRGILNLEIGGGISARGCELSDLTKLSTTSACRFADCYTLGAATIDLATNSSNAVFRRFSGVLVLINMDGTNSVDIEGTGDITVDSTCTGGTVNVRGNFKITDNSSGAVTINTTAAGVNVTQINGFTTLVTAWAAVLDNTEVITVTGTSTSTSVVFGALASVTDDTYIDRVLLFRKDTTTAALRGRPAYVTDYTGATKTLTVDQLPASPAVGDTAILLP